MAAAIVKRVQEQWEAARYKALKAASKSSRFDADNLSISEDQLPQPYYLFFALNLVMKMESLSVNRTASDWNSLLGNFIPSKDRTGIDPHLFRLLHCTVKVSDDELHKELLTFKRAARDYGVYVERCKEYSVVTPHLSLSPSEHEISQPDSPQISEKSEDQDQDKDEVEIIIDAVDIEEHNVLGSVHIEEHSSAEYFPLLNVPLACPVPKYPVLKMAEKINEETAGAEMRQKPVARTGP